MIELSQNDDLVTVIKKCNTNFKQAAWSSDQSLRKRSRIDNAAIQDVLEGMSEQIRNAVNVVIPQEIEEQIQAQNIPALVSREVESQIEDLDIQGMIDDSISQMLPAIGTYEMSQASPSYPNTTWQQVDSITTDGNVVIPIWIRTA